MKKKINEGKEFLMGPFYFKSVADFEKSITEIFQSGLVCKVKITKVFCPSVKIKENV